MEKENKKEGLKVGFVVAMVIILLGVLITLVVMMINNFKKETKLPDWGEKYYDYLKDFKTSKTTKTLLAKHNLQIKDEYRGDFYTYDKKLPPAMVLEYSEPVPSGNNGNVAEPTEPSEPEVVTPEPGEPEVITPDPSEPDVVHNYIVIVLLINDEIKEYVFEADSVSVELLYNIEEKEYYYYIMYQLDDSTHFIKLNDYIKSLTDDSYEYEEIVIGNGETVLIDGEEILKIDVTFYEPGNVKGAYFKFNPNETDNLKDSMLTYYDNIEEVYGNLTNGKKNGLDDHLNNYFYIIIEIYGDDYFGEPEEPGKVEPPVEEPGKVEPPVEEPITACEYDYMTYLPSYGQCVDLGQLVTPGGCDYGYVEQDGYCYSFECDGLPETGMDTNCQNKYPVPGPNECPPGNNLYDGYCIRN